MKFFIVPFIVLLFATFSHAEQIKVEIAIGCPTVELYKEFNKRTNAGVSAINAGATLGCLMLFKGDRVKVLDWKLRGDLVRVHPEGNSMTFWFPAEFVTGN